MTTSLPKIIFAFVYITISTLFTLPSFADTHVRGYFRKNGTYVAPHYRSSPNSTKLDNWSTKGNINPYTGKVGTKNIYETPPTKTIRPILDDYLRTRPSQPTSLPSDQYNQYPAN
jgi:hypothetical protein